MLARTRPTITSHRADSLLQTSAREILDSLKTFAADGGARPISGGTPFRQPCPAYPSTMGGRHRRHVSARKVSEYALPSETRFSKAQLQVRYTQHRAENPQHTASLDVLAEPNYYSKCLQTSSTRVFASHQAAAWKSESALNQSTETRLGWGTRGVLADSASSLYTTSFPIHSTARPACLPDAGLAMFTKRSAWVGLLRMAGGWE